ncbi:hypothetical protein HDU85_001563 [Gaertneriomyces sp. JEL0708]|nr:hypothetical protein HDU85_001563 [Gaertneriomyces sp. JEL0708]
MVRIIDSSKRNDSMELFDELEAAHIFPFGLHPYVPRLSALVYPEEFFVLMRAGEEINSPVNGVLIVQGLHRKSYGLHWWLTHEDNRYRVCANERLAPLHQHRNKIIDFNEPRPDPILINLHAMMGMIRAEMERAGLWKAGGDREDDVLREEGQQVLRRAEFFYSVEPIVDVPMASGNLSEIMEENIPPLVL